MGPASAASLIPGEADLAGALCQAPQRPPLCTQLWRAWQVLWRQAAQPCRGPCRGGVAGGECFLLDILDTVRLTAEAGVDLLGQRFVQLEIQSKVLAGRPWPFTCMEHLALKVARRTGSIVWSGLSLPPPHPALSCAVGCSLLTPSMAS